MLQISFAVEIFRFDIANSLGKVAIDYNEVAGEVLIVKDFNDAADLDLVGFYWFKSVFASGNAAGITGVLLYIT